MNPGNPIVALSEFLRSPAGRYVLDWEQAHIDAAVVDIFGYHALQLGLPEIDALRENRMPLRFCAADRQFTAPPQAVATDGTGTGSAGNGGERRVAVIHRYEELPFATHSIDLVVMPHILEFAHDPHQVLREVERVLVPEGHVVITGFNPASLWGLRQFGVRLGATPFLPREGRFIALPRIKDWLKLLSFEFARGRFGCYAPSVRTAAWLNRWRFLEKAGDRWWPVLGAVYLLTAVKRVRGMRLVGKVWQHGEERAPRLATIGSSKVAITTADARSAVVCGDEPAANEAPLRARRG